MKLIPIGFGSYVSAARIVAALDPDSNPIKRVVAQAREDGKLLDATYGRKTETVLVMDSGHVILCPVEPGVLVQKTEEKGDHSADAN